MSVNDYIRGCKEKNKKLFSAEIIQITPKELEKQLRHAYRSGYVDGEKLKSFIDRVYGKDKRPPSV